jgi:hypothetical protein
MLQAKTFLRKACVRVYSEHGSAVCFVIMLGRKVVERCEVMGSTIDIGGN